MICGRNSIGYELNPEFGRIFESRIKDIAMLSKKVNKERIDAHINFINQQLDSGKELRHINRYYNFKVTTSHEKELLLYEINEISSKGGIISINHEPYYLD